MLDAKGENHHLGPDDYTVEILGSWTSPDTGCTYPSGWRITIGDMSLEVTPKVINQELHADHDIWIGPEYWEGASYVKGTHSGQAYVELNGFCRDIEGGIDL